MKKLTLFVLLPVLVIIVWFHLRWFFAPKTYCENFLWNIANFLEDKVENLDRYLLDNADWYYRSNFLLEFEWPRCKSVAWVYFDERDWEPVVETHLYNRRNCKHRAREKMWLSYNWAVVCVEDLSFASEYWDIWMNALYDYIYDTDVLSYLRWDDYEYDWLFYLSWENMLWETTKYDRDNNCVYKSTWIKMCRKNKHTDKWFLYNKSWKLCSEIIGKFFWKMVYTDFDCLFEN